ncbi:Glucose transport transcription regulator RGT1 [Fusarium oxysporum f. sp. albedinis]|nr:Glucose transport transcription regulator RGT1 [Fusarium oxysporum f. sp. albedinis]
MSLQVYTPRDIAFTDAIYHQYPRLVIVMEPKAVIQALRINPFHLAPLNDCEMHLDHDTGQAQAVPIMYCHRCEQLHHELDMQCQPQTMRPLLSTSRSCTY